MKKRQRVLQAVGVWKVYDTTDLTMPLEEGCLIVEGRVPWWCWIFGHHFDASHPGGVCAYQGYAARRCVRCGALHPRDRQCCETLLSQEGDVCGET